MSPGIEDEGEVDIAGAGFVAGLGVVLEKLCTQEAGESKATRFDAVRCPVISVRDYLHRLHSYFACSTECFVLALIYVDRLVQRQPQFQLSHLNVHRVVLAALTIAAKFLDDRYYSNDYYGRVGGVRVKELNALEMRMLDLLKWRLIVTPEEYCQYREAVLCATGKPSAAAGGPMAIDVEWSGCKKPSGGVLSFTPEARTKAPSCASTPSTYGKEWVSVGDESDSDDEWMKA